MIKYIKYACFFVLAALLFAACAKEEEKFIPEEGKSYKSRLSGLVLDEAGQPIADVAVQYGNKNAVTDVDGFYEFKDVEANDIHNFVSLKKTGYFESAKAFTVSSNTNVELKSILVKQQFNFALSATKGGKVSNSLVEIEFPANGMVVESTGEDYNGNINIAIHYIDPTSREGILSMPGNLSGVNVNNDFVTLKSFGMVNVDLWSDDGKKLQLKKGSKATMSCVISASLLDKANESLPMWSFDFKTGLWKEEGIAKKEGNKYVGEVSHFSSWNYDTFIPSVNLSGRVVDDKGNALSVHINIIGKQSGTLAHGYTNARGIFSGRVAKDDVLQVIIYANDLCIGSNGIFSSTIGPFSDDTSIGDIVIRSSVFEEVKVNASLLDCADKPLTDFRVKIYVDDRLYNIESVDNANYERSFTACAGSKVSIVFVNPLESKETNTITLSKGLNNLGTVSVCEQQQDFIDISVAELGLTFNISNSPTLITLNGSKRFSGLSATNSSIINFRYQDNNPDYVFIGTYDISYFTMNLSYGGTVYTYKQDFVGKVTITKGGTIGDKIKGVLSGKLSPQNLSVSTHNINGSFQITY